MIVIVASSDRDCAPLRTVLLGKLAKSTFNLADDLLGPEKKADEKPGDEEEDETLQTNGEAIVNLLNNCLGSGMLTMGFAIGNAGILPSLLLMLLSAFLNRYTLLLNFKVCRKSGVDPATAAIGEAAFGGPGRVFVSAAWARTRRP